MSQLHNRIFSSTAIFLLAVLISCNICRADKGSNQRIKTFYLGVDWNLIDPSSGKISHIKDSLEIRYFDDLIFYRIPKTTERYESTNSGDTGTTTLVSTEVNYIHYVYKKGGDFGLMYDSLSALAPGKIPVDSFLTASGFKGFPFYRPDNDVLVEIIKDRNLATAKFTAKIKLPTHSDTAFFYFDRRLKEVDYSFSWILDSTMNSKVYKVRYLYNAVKTKEGLLLSPKREMIFELKSTQKKPEPEFINFARKVSGEIDSILLVFHPRTR